MIEKVIKPRCPMCKKCQADWVETAQFTCPHCKTTFIIGVGYVTILSPLANVKVNGEAIVNPITLFNKRSRLYTQLTRSRNSVIVRNKT